MKLSTWNTTRGMAKQFKFKIKLEEIFYRYDMRQLQTFNPVASAVFCPATISLSL